MEILLVLRFKKGIVRVLEPGVFDYQSEKFVIRMRAWGVNFPQRGKPGYQNAINFTEKQLLSINPNIKVKMTFDDKNLKVVDLRISSDGSSFSRLAIENGIGWHNEKETNRYGPFVIAQLKAKRSKEGLWSSGYDLPQDNDLNKPRPTLPESIHKILIIQYRKFDTGLLHLEKYIGLVAHFTKEAGEPFQLSQKEWIVGFAVEEKENKEINYSKMKVFHLWILNQSIFH